jgi:hypothetical protein
VERIEPVSVEAVEERNRGLTSPARLEDEFGWPVPGKFLRGVQRSARAGRRIRTLAVPLTLDRSPALGRGKNRLLWVRKLAKIVGLANLMDKLQINEAM